MSNAADAKSTKDTKESRLTEQIARLEGEKERLAERLYQSQMMELDVRRKLEAARETLVSLADSEADGQSGGADEG